MTNLKRIIHEAVRSVLMENSEDTTVLRGVLSTSLTNLSSDGEEAINSTRGHVLHVGGVTVTVERARAERYVDDEYGSIDGFDEHDVEVDIVAESIGTSVNKMEDAVELALRRWLADTTGQDPLWGFSWEECGLEYRNGL